MTSNAKNFKWNLWPEFQAMQSEFRQKPWKKFQDDKFIIIIHSSSRNYIKERASDFWFSNTKKKNYSSLSHAHGKALQILFIEFALFAVQRCRTQKIHLPDERQCDVITSSFCCLFDLWLASRTHQPVVLVHRNNSRIQLVQICSWEHTKVEFQLVRWTHTKLWLIFYIQPNQSCSQNFSQF